MYVTAECQPQKDAFLTVTVHTGIQCYIVKANNYQDCWKEQDHITLGKANLLASVFYFLSTWRENSNTWSLHKFPLCRRAGCTNTRFSDIVLFGKLPISIPILKSFITCFSSKHNELF